MKTELSPYGTPPKLTTNGTLKNGVLVGAPKIPSENVKANLGEKDFRVDISDASRQAATKLPTPSVPDIEVLEPTSVEVPKKPADAKPINPELKTSIQKKPAIIFVSGWQGMISPSKSEGSYAGVGRMAEAVKGARVYDWDQKDEIIEQIQRTHADFPVILVGHSLGGDTVKEVADALDSLDHNFREIDLLVTIDAVGFGNDIIGQNVKQHLNVFGENDLFLNDGPHVARRHEKTSVKNILSPLDHTELDDAKDIQFEIMQAIKSALGGRNY